jgi:hypothetical protein
MLNECGLYTKVFTGGGVSSVGKLTWLMVSLCCMLTKFGVSVGLLTRGRVSKRMIG